MTNSLLAIMLRVACEYHWRNQHVLYVFQNSFVRLRAFYLLPSVILVISHAISYRLNDQGACRESTQAYSPFNEMPRSRILAFQLERFRNYSHLKFLIVPEFCVMMPRLCVGLRASVQKRIEGVVIKCTNQLGVPLPFCSSFLLIPPPLHVPFISRGFSSVKYVGSSLLLNSLYMTG